MKKQITAAITAALITLSLTACSGVRGNANENGNNIGTNSIAKSDLSTKTDSEVISESDIEAVKNTYNSEDETVYDTKIIDLDFDGKNELLLLVGKVNTREFDVWTKNSSEMTRESSFGTGKVNFIDKISLKKSEVNGDNVYLFSFSYDEEGSMKADEILSVIKKTKDGSNYEVEHLLSRGSITYSDIAEPFTKEFYRKGWSKYDIGLDADYGNITQEEYNRLYEEYTSSIIPQVSEWKDFIGPDGQPVTLSDATVDEQGRVTFDYGFIKYAPQIYDDSLKNPDLINWETFEFAPYNATYTPTVKRLKVGDVLENGLKVTKAYETLEFGAYMDEATLESRSEWGSYGGELSFDGELTLSGALYCVPEDDYQVFEGELYFFPDTTSFSQLPIGCGFIPAENKEYTVLERVFSDVKLAVVGGAMYYLGNISETDCGDVIEKGTAVEVTVTIEKIRIVSSNTNYGGRGGGIFANIVSIEKINN